MQRDLTSGSVVKNLLYMAIPTMFGFMSQTLYDLVDMIWIGRISAEAVASVTIFATIYWMAFVLNNIIGTSSVSMISQSYGAGDMPKAKRIVEQTFAFKGLLAIVATIIIMLLLQPLVAFFTDDPLVMEGALSYGRLRLFFLPVMFSYFTVSTALRCTGDSKSPMYIMMFASALNIILDPIFIFDTVPVIGIRGLNMGIYGAAVATVISTTSSFLLGCWILFSGKSNIKPSIKGMFKLDWEIDKKLITIGLPTGIEGLLRNLAQFFTLRFIAIYGTAAVAALGIINRVLGFVFMPLSGLMSGGSTIVGQNLGNDNIDRAERTAKTAALLGSISMAVFTVVSFLFANQIVTVFVDDAEVIRLGVLALRIVIPGMIFTGVFIGLATVFTGSGYNMPFLVASLVGRWAVQLPFLLVTVVWLKLSFVWVVISYVLSELASFAVVYGAYRQGKWKYKRAVADVDSAVESA